MFKSKLSAIGLSLCLIVFSMESGGQTTTTPAIWKYTANDVVAPYNTKFLYGVNPGFYANGWSDKMVAEIAHFAGANSGRFSLPGTFIDKYGPDIRKPEFDYYVNTLGMSDLTLFVEQPADDEKPSGWYGSCGQPKIFDNLYTEIWDNGEDGTPINDQNYFAAYIYKLVLHYGDKVRFWEIWNEPDYSYSAGAWQIPGQSGNWWENVPAPCDLKNLNAPVYTYIRMLRVAYEVIKTFKPNDLVCTGGLGYESFLDILLRHTDNPDNGTVSADYPLTGGAYFDVLSFHTYPHFKLTQWDYALGKFVSKRHSDEAVAQYVNSKNAFVNVLKKYGYGTTYPAKHVICTEVNLPRKQFNNYIGSVEAQRNFMFKMLVKSQAENIRQVYMYQTGDTEDYATATSPFNLMGLFQNLKKATYRNETLTDAGIAFKTTSELLSGYSYDAAETQKLAVPAGVDGYAFKDSKNHFRYVLWATTTTDMSESASADYTFPTEIAFSNANGYLWNFSVDRSKKTTGSSRTVKLDGSPVVFDLTVPVDETNILPVVYAGGDTAITLPTSSFKATLAYASDPDGRINTYYWSQVSGASKAVFDNAWQPNPTISGLTVADTYKFTLKATDNFNGVSVDTLTLVVNPEPYQNKLPVARAGADITINQPTSATYVNGAASYDPDGTIVEYYWYQINGSNAKFANPWQASPQVYNLTTAGTYTFVLRVMDNDRGRGYDTMKVTVNAKVSSGSSSNSSGTNKSPVANPGYAFTINSLSATAYLTGSGSYDTDGSIKSYLWRFESGPGSAWLYNTWKPNAYAKNFSKAGTYVFSLEVTDNKGAKNKKTVSVTVKSGARVATVDDSPDTAAVMASPDAAILTTDDPLRASLFPNPVQTQATLVLEGSAGGKTTTALCNASGMELSRESFEKSPGKYTRTIRFNALPAGLYFLKVQVADQAPVTLKVMVQ
ncbi:MAG: PKD domain-containing protein [Flavihumibacter sp.]